MEKSYTAAPLDGAPVPPIDGPKLGPFKHPLAKEQKSSIQLLEYISDPNKGKEGAHAHVLAARIGTRRFALKIFKFVDVLSLRSEFFPLSVGIADDEDELILYHSDPFYAECRAYGKIEELQEHLRSKGRSNSTKRYQVAVPCYGYLTLPADPFEKHMQTQYGITNWDRPAWERNLRAEERRPFRVLVKKLVNDSEPIREPKRMRDQLELLAKWGVYPFDLRQDNYIGGYLIDFSFAWTRPYWVQDILSGEELEDKLNENFWMFNIMMKRSPKHKDKFYRAGLSKDKHKDPRRKPKFKNAPSRKQPTRESRSSDPVDYSDVVRRKTKV